MLVKGYLMVVLCLVVANAVRTRQRSRCRDRMLHIADGKYPCRMLVDPGHRHQAVVGAYANREALCMKPRYSGCCKTCLDQKIVDMQKPVKSKADKPKVYKTLTPQYQITSGVTCKDDRLRVADGTYACSMLVDRKHRSQAMVGAYKYRKRLCSSPGFSGCCKTCKEHNLVKRNPRRRRPRPKHQKKPKVVIINGVEIDRSCKDSGLFVAGGGYSCKLLVDQNDTRQSYLGAYMHREKLCNLTHYSGCCRTCIVHGITDYKPRPKMSKTPRKEQKTVVEHKLKYQSPSYCQDSGLNIADGGYDCRMLRDKHHGNQAVVGAYKNRRKLCTRAGFSGCCFTCQSHVINRSRRQCKDEYVVVRRNKQTYACRELLQRRSDIYPDRFDLCADPVNTRCCKTCTKLAKTKYTGGLAKNTNLINKPKFVEILAVEEIDTIPGRTKTVDKQKAFKMMQDLLKKLMVYTKNRPVDRQIVV